MKIEYDFDPNGYFAFYIDKNGSKKYFCSLNSFEEAKTKLIEYLKKEGEVIIPQPEEIEL